MNYANVAYDSLTYKMASATLTIESNSKWPHCDLMYSDIMPQVHQSMEPLYYRGSWSKVH